MSMVWLSPSFSKRERLLALLAPPGGLAAVFVMFSLTGQSHTCQQVLNPSNGHIISSACTSSSALPHVLAATFLLVFAAAAFTTFLRLWRVASAVPTFSNY